MNQYLIDLIAKKDAQDFKIHVDCIPDQVKAFAEKMTELLELDALIRYASADVDSKDIFDFKSTMDAFDDNINERKQWIKDNYGEVWVKPKENKKDGHYYWNGGLITPDCPIVSLSDLISGKIEPTLIQFVISNNDTIYSVEKLYTSDGGKITSFVVVDEEENELRFFIDKGETNNA